MTSVDGTEPQVLAFAEPIAGAPLWSRLWVDGEGLVRRADTLTAGHVMTQTFSDFDAPLALAPPPGATA